MKVNNIFELAFVLMVLMIRPSVVEASCAEFGMGYDDGDPPIVIPPITTETWEACGVACNDYQGCAYWTWSMYTNPRVCAFFANDNGRAELPWGISGDKNCFIC